MILIFKIIVGFHFNLTPSLEGSLIFKYTPKNPANAPINKVIINVFMEKINWKYWSFEFINPSIKNKEFNKSLG